MTAKSRPLTTAEMQATAGWKQQQDHRYNMDAIKSRDACKNSDAGNSMEGGQQQREIIGTLQRQQQKGDPQQQGCQK